MKTIFPSKKLFRPIFSRNVEYNKPQGEQNIGSTYFCDSYCATYKIISLGPAISMKTIFENKANFTMKNNFGQFFHVLPCMADLK